MKTSTPIFLSALLSATLLGQASPAQEQARIPRIIDASAFSSPPAGAPSQRSQGIMGGIMDQFSSRAPSFTSPASPASPGRSATTIDLSGRELTMIGRRDVVIVVDRSASMAEADCPPSLTSQLTGLLPGFSGGFRQSRPMSSITRWRWCQEQLSYMARQTSAALRNGFTVVMFSSGYSIFKGVTTPQVPSLFASVQPSGGTNTAKALKSVLNDYFRRRDSAAAAVKPLAVAVITDGVPDSPRALEDVLVEATRRMRSPGELAVCFLQVGMDGHGGDVLRRLDDQLMQQGATADIVDHLTFAELQRFGLSRALTRAISEASGEH